VNGLRDSILNFSSDVQDVSSKDVIEMMMITQYFDMLKDVGSSNRCAPLLPLPAIFLHFFFYQQGPAPCLHSLSQVGCTSCARLS
jgi:hypothetical protein